MKLKSLNNLVSLLIFLITSSQILYAEDQIDIWKKENKEIKNSEQIKEQDTSLSNFNNSENTFSPSSVMNFKSFRVETFFLKKLKLLIIK